MARIEEGVLQNYTNGMTMTADDYERDREILRTSINDTEDKLGLLNPERIQEFQTQIGDINGTVNQGVKAVQEAAVETVEARAGYPTLKERLDDVAVSVKKYDAKGDGATDDTVAFQTAINQAITDGLTLYIPSGKYVISDTLVINYGFNSLDNKGFKILGQSTNNTILLGKLIDKPLIDMATTNHKNLRNGVELGDFAIDSFSSDYKQKFDGIVLRNCFGNIYKRIRVENCNNGLWLKPDTSLNQAGTAGYLEQNHFEDIQLLYNLRSLTFKVGASNVWTSSLHGNIFDKVSITVDSTSAIKAVGQAEETKVVAINAESGHIYNCRFNLKIFLAGANAYMFDINGSSGANDGVISYEVFGSSIPKIATGDNALAKFFLNGPIHGFGEDQIDWSGYRPISVGELNYDNSKIAVDSSFAELGKDKFYSENLFPPKELPVAQMYSGIPVLTPVANKLTDLWGGMTHYFTRYKNKSGNEENGFIMACKEVAGAGSRFIIGTIPTNKRNIQDFVPGFYIKADGKFIKSASQGSQITFTSGGIAVSGSVINVSNNKTPASATAAGATGDICWDANYIYVCIYTNTWKRVAIATW